MNPRNPRILFAAMWQLVIKTWARDSGGPGSGLSTLAGRGANMEAAGGHGLPNPARRRIGWRSHRRNPIVCMR